MTTATQATTHTEYALERSAREYERLRVQARSWEPSTARLLDDVGVPPGATCLDAGCGPGETMRLLAQRVGPSGAVTGVDVDAALGARVETSLHRAGYPQCRFRSLDLTADAPIPGAPFDVVYARLLLFHLPRRVPVLRRLWDAVAPGGHLILQDYDLEAAELHPPLASVDEIVRVLIGAFVAMDCDIRVGLQLPLLFTRAGIGEPDGTDVAGRVEPLAGGCQMLEETFRSVLPVALAHQITDARHAEAALSALRDDATRFPDYRLLWPLMFGAWKRKRSAEEER